MTGSVVSYLRRQVSIPGFGLRAHVASQSLILTVSLPAGLNEFQPGETVIFKAGVSGEEKDVL